MGYQACWVPVGWDVGELDVIVCMIGCLLVRTVADQWHPQDKGR